MHADTIDELATVRSELAATLARLDRLLQTDQVGGGVFDLLTLPRTRAIEWVLERADVTLRPVEIWFALQSHGRRDPKMDVQVTTYDLWKRGRIDRRGRGRYCRKGLDATSTSTSGAHDPTAPAEVDS